MSKRAILSVMVAWLTFGLILEFLLGTKQPLYLDLPIRREMWRLAHAHGVLMALVYLSFDHHWGFARALERRLVQLGLILMPLGFFLGGLLPTESDPWVGVLIAPMGGLAFMAGLGAALLLKPKSAAQ